jgi:hypothetical protein
MAACPGTVNVISLPVMRAVPLTVQVLSSLSFKPVRWRFDSDLVQLLRAISPLLAVRASWLVSAA